jgi:Tripartite tricarboxylate transporter family receptor
MKLPRRKFLHLAAGAAALPAVSRVAWPQAYPSRPVRLIAPFAAGGISDAVARLMGQWLSERLGQPFIIDNRPGGGSNIGTEAVVRAPPDGYMLLMAGSYNAINATLYEKLNFNFIRDITAVAGIVRVPSVMVVHPCSGHDRPRVHRLCQGQSRQGQHGIGRQWGAGSCLWRAVQDDGRGFAILSVEDLTSDWAVILRQRLAMYQELRKEAQQANTPAGHDAFYESYVRFVDLVNEAALGGGRFAGEKPKPR